MANSLQVEAYDYTELVTDVVMILFAVRAPYELACIVAHDYGKQSRAPRPAPPNHPPPPLYFRAIYPITPESYARILCNCSGEFDYNTARTWHLWQPSIQLAGRLDDDDNYSVKV